MITEWKDTKGARVSIHQPKTNYHYEITMDSTETRLNLVCDNCNGEMLYDLKPNKTNVVRRTQEEITKQDSAYEKDRMAIRCQYCKKELK